MAICVNQVYTPTARTSNLQVVRPSTVVTVLSAPVRMQPKSMAPMAVIDSNGLNMSAPSGMSAGTVIYTGR